MTTVFERATPADGEAMLRIQIRAFESDAALYPGVEPGGPPGYDSIEGLLDRIQQDETVKIVHDGEIVGGMTVFDKGNGHYHLDTLFIDPEYHNLGIGSKAMEYLEQAYSATKWTLDTPLYAVRNQHFYEKFGYVKAGEWQEEGTGLILIKYEKSG